MEHKKHLSDMVKDEWLFRDAMLPVMVLQLLPDNFYSNLFRLPVVLLDESVTCFLTAVGAFVIILGLLVLLLVAVAVAVAVCFSVASFQHRRCFLQFARIVFIDLCLLVRRQ